MNPAAKCTAKDKAKCRFHSALARMRVALKNQDADAYLSARMEAEATLTVREPGLFAPKPDVDLRYSLIGNLDSAAAYQQAATLPKAEVRAATKATKLKDPQPVPPGYMHLPGQATSDHPYRIQDARHETGTHCECGHTFTRREIFDTCEQEQITCPACGNRDYAGMGETRLMPEAIKLFEPEAVRATTWWHSTQNPNWEATLAAAKETPFIHAGTLLSALMRARSGKGRTDTYLYELKLVPEAPIAARVFDDENQDEDTRLTHPHSVEAMRRQPHQYDTYEPDAVNRYINVWEDSGNLSIMTIPANMRIVGRRRLEMRGREWNWGAQHIDQI
jgi:hypothetical protein